jgi:alpha-galactosidase
LIGPNTFFANHFRLWRHGLYSYTEKQQIIMLGAGDMNKEIKTTIVGGASITWMAIFMKDICDSKAMGNGSLVLHDIDVSGVETMRRFAEKFIGERGSGIKVKVEQDLRAAVSGADFVINTVLIGSHSTWRDEQNLILKYGLQHPKGMSVGPGGMIMGIKQIPFIISLAKLMEEVCPQAWLLNFSNPMQLLMLAVQRCSTIKSIGFCHGVKGTIEKMARILDIPEQELSIVAGGVNHFEIVMKLVHNGVDMFPAYLKRLEEIDSETGYCGEWITRDMYKLFGGFPTNEDIHSIEYLPYYIRKGVEVIQFHQEHNYIENRIANRNQRWKLFDEYLAGRKSFDDLEKPKSTEYLDKIMDAIVENKPYLVYGNSINNGYITNLPKDICVEVPLLISRDGYLGTCVGDLPRGLAEFSALHGAVQNFMVEGALTGSREKLLSGLSLDPMCYSLSLDERRSLIRELIEMDREFLPAFYPHD